MKDEMNKIKIDSGNGKILMDDTYHPYLEPSILAVWEMNESSGTTMYDETLRNVDGTIDSGVGLEGSYYQIDRDNDSHVYIDTPSKLSLNNFTMSCWVTPKTDALWASVDGNINYLNDSINNRQLYLTIAYAATSNLVSLGCTMQDSSGITATSKGTYATETTYHLVATFDGTDLNVYVNNIIGLSDTYAGSSFDLNPSYALIGSNGGFADYEADLHQLAMWKRELTTAEIAELYNNGTVLPYESWSTSLKS